MTSIPRPGVPWVDRMPHRQLPPGHQFTELGVGDHVEDLVVRGVIGEHVAESHGGMAHSPPPGATRAAGRALNARRAEISRQRPPRGHRGTTTPGRSVTRILSRSAGPGGLSTKVTLNRWRRRRPHRPEPVPRDRGPDRVDAGDGRGDEDVDPRTMRVVPVRAPASVRLTDARRVVRRPSTAMVPVPVTVSGRG